MKKNWIFAAVAAVLTGLFSSCADPYYGAGYGSGDYPRNTAEAVVPLVVGAALVSAIISNNQPRNCNYYGGGGYHGGYPPHCPPPRCYR